MVELPVRSRAGDQADRHDSEGQSKQGPGAGASPVGEHDAQRDQRDEKVEDG